MTARGISLIMAAVIGVQAHADAPLAPAPATICSTANRACATRSADGHSVMVWRRGRTGARDGAWTAQIASPRLAVSDDGRSLVEIYPGLTLLAADAGPDTVVLAFHRPGALPVRIRLREVVARPDALPKTVSHRQWASAFGFDGAGFELIGVDGTRMWFDPATGRRR